MAVDKIFHNVIQPWTGTDGALATAGAGVEGADLKTSEWFDVTGWTNKVIAFEVDSDGTIDFNVWMDVSSRGAYELNNTTATTEDYVRLTIVEAHTAAVYIRKDFTDLDDLDRPVRSLRIIIENDEAEPVTGVNLWIEGVS
jgi:hypothetical protein